VRVAHILELLECAVLLVWSDSGGYRVAGYSVSASSRGEWLSPKPKLRSELCKTS
jgi:hypothetical protein